MLINIDSEEEGILTVGSAGGEGVEITLPIEKSIFVILLLIGLKFKIS